MFLQHLPSLSTRPSLSELWITVLDYMDKFLNLENSDLLVSCISWRNVDNKDNSLSLSLSLSPLPSLPPSPFCTMKPYQSPRRTCYWSCPLKASLTTSWLRVASPVSLSLQSSSSGEWLGGELRHSCQTSSKSCFQASLHPLQVKPHTPLKIATAERKRARKL